ncbi:hypothetical protein U27_04415 [Candidatus Vecturithrix granuli]|uniref:Uncharacterized protein n=1 Tax=Vecturithrix granuli TaxID=1499967 RepID=A0A081BYP3_VECG1|nr:hypothetical protein U27_04415 [Candidatus Vecturithrix granuli]
MEQEYKSRTQIKNEMKALQELGERLVAFSPEALEQIDMPENLREAVLFAQKIPSREALRRQLQYIGGLMRTVNPEAIRREIAMRDHRQQASTQALHQLETWRDDLIAGKTGLIDELCQRFPAADRQHLRQLVRNAQKEQEQAKSPKSARTLFRYLRELMQSAELPQSDQTGSEATTP